MSAPQDGVMPADFSVGEDGDAMEYIRRRGIGELGALMGIEFTEFTRARATATMPVEGNRQPIGLLHGGAYCVLGESLGSMHANLVAPAGKVAVGVDINATHTLSAVSGVVTGTCNPIHLGNSIAVHEIVVTDEAGQRCSTIRITNMYKDRR